VSSTEFRELIVGITAELAGRPLDQALDTWLNTEHGPTSATYLQLQDACVSGVKEGWLADREGGGLRYGRIFKPAEDLQGFSVDVAALHTGHGNVMPQSLHGGPGRAGGGEELGGLRALNFYHRRSAIQASTAVLAQLQGDAV